MKDALKIIMLTVVIVVAGGYLLFSSWATGAFSGGSGIAGYNPTFGDYLVPILLVVGIVLLIFRLLKGH